MKLIKYPSKEQWAELLKRPAKREGIKTPSAVQYVARAGHIKKYYGTYRILKVILSYDYLWINLRVKGGAYGCMSGFKRNGESFLVSYRDPHLKRTLEVYQGVPDYIRAFEADEREMTKYHRNDQQQGCAENSADAGKYLKNRIFLQCYRGYAPEGKKSDPRSAEGGYPEIGSSCRSSTF